MLFPKFIETIDAIGFMSLAVLPEAVAMLCISKMLGQEKTKVILITKLLALATIMIGFITFGPVFGITGLAWIFVLASILQACVLGISTKIHNKKNEVR